MEVDFWPVTVQPIDPSTAVITPEQSVMPPSTTITLPGTEASISVTEASNSGSTTTTVLPPIFFTTSHPVVIQPQPTVSAPVPPPGTEGPSPVTYSNGPPKPTCITGCGSNSCLFGCGGGCGLFGCGGGCGLFGCGCGILGCGGGCGLLGCQGGGGGGGGGGNPSPSPTNPTSCQNTQTATDCIAYCSVTSSSGTTSTTCSSTTCYSTFTGCAVTGTTTSATTTADASCPLITPGTPLTPGDDIFEGCAPCAWPPIPVPTDGTLAPAPGPGFDVLEGGPESFPEKRALAGRINYNYMHKRAGALDPSKVNSIGDCVLTATPPGTPVTRPAWTGGADWMSSDFLGGLDPTQTAMSRWYSSTTDGCTPVVTKVPAATMWANSATHGKPTIDHVCK